jgi:hypothetical protein
LGNQLTVFAPRPRIADGLDQLEGPGLQVETKSFLYNVLWLNIQRRRSPGQKRKFQAPSGLPYAPSQGGKKGPNDEGLPDRYGLWHGLRAWDAC